MAIDWHTLWVPDVALAELVLRGSIMYLALFALLRVLVRRQLGSLSLMDLLLVVLIADAAQNAMAGGYKSVPEGLVLCGTMIGWNYLLDLLAYQSPAIRRWLEPTPLPLVRDGRVERHNLRSELVTLAELRSHLREQGVENISNVKLAFMEPDGQISVIKRGADHDQRPPRRVRRGAG